MLMMMMVINRMNQMNESNEKSNQIRSGKLIIYRENEKKTPMKKWNDSNSTKKIERFCVRIHWFVFLFHSKLTMMISIWQSPQYFCKRKRNSDLLNEKKSKTTNGSHLINQFIQCKSYFKFIENKQRKHTTHQNKTKKFWFFFENNKNEQLNDNNNNFCSMNSSGKNYEFFVLKGTSTILHTFLFVKL